MAQHTRPEILRSVHATISAVRPTCHLCSWTWRAGAFIILRPSGACLMHRDLFSDGRPPVPGAVFGLAV